MKEKVQNLYLALELARAAVPELHSAVVAAHGHEAVRQVDTPVIGH